EQLGEETGCWIYLAAQHPHAHKLFANYTSRRLSLDHIPLLDKIHNSVNRLFVSLQRSRRSNAAELSADLLFKEAALTQAQSEAEGLRAENERLQEE
ncbi:hypothetical protein GYMLUDRAFT_113830, partial [Collybiopsis luxurians FD-317 M1]